MSYNYTTYLHACEVPDSPALDYENGYARVNYTVGSRDFVAIVPDPAQKLQKYLVIGDWGLLYNMQGEYDDIMPCLNQYLVENYTAVLFMGDLAYDLESKNCL